MWVLIELQPPQNENIKYSKTPITIGANLFMELTSEQLTILLNSRDGRKCNRATKYLFKRGTKSLNFLLTLQGNEEFFAGSCIENPYSAFSSSFLFPKEVYESGARTTPIEEDKERAVTVEVAALYLISSIYYGRLTCACNALLMDLSLPKSEQKMANKKAYLLRGFQAAQEWVQKCQRVGIQTLRKHGERPLNSVKLYWYGSRSDPISCEVEIIPAKPIQWNWKTIVSHYNGLIQQNQSDTIETREWGKTHDMEEEDFLKMDQRYEILLYDHVDVSISIDDNSTVDDEFEWLSRFQPIGKDIFGYFAGCDE
jgi:hypothetical protein